jgi:DNA polymerase-3 subunit chi
LTEIRFYHLQRTALERALPEILEKILERKWRAVVLAGSEERVEALNQHLWTWRGDSFLPHGSSRDGNATDQPVWLTHEEENPNGATVLVLTDGTIADSVSCFDFVCVLFDGNDGDAVRTARGHWKRYKAEGHDLTYWQQSTRGGWEKKA